jgi:hypothetical protein
MNLSLLRECASEHDPEYVSVRFECGGQFDTEELPPFVDKEGREWKHANDRFVEAAKQPDQRPA